MPAEQAAITSRVRFLYQQVGAGTGLGKDTATEDVGDDESGIALAVDAKVDELGTGEEDEGGVLWIPSFHHVVTRKK